MCTAPEQLSTHLSLRHHTGGSARVSPDTASWPRLSVSAHGWPSRPLSSRPPRTVLCPLWESAVAHPFPGRTKKTSAGVPVSPPAPARSIAASPHVQTVLTPALVGPPGSVLCISGCSPFPQPRRRIGTSPHRYARACVRRVLPPVLGGGGGSSASGWVAFALPERILYYTVDLKSTYTYTHIHESRCCIAAAT